MVDLRQLKHHGGRCYHGEMLTTMKPAAKLLKHVRQGEPDITSHIRHHHLGLIARTSHTPHTPHTPSARERRIASKNPSLSLVACGSLRENGYGIEAQPSKITVRSSHDSSSASSACGAPKGVGMQKILENHFSGTSWSVETRWLHMTRPIILASRRPPNRRRLRSTCVSSFSYGYLHPSLFSTRCLANFARLVQCLPSYGYCFPVSTGSQTGYRRAGTEDLSKAQSYLSGSCLLVFSAH
ncbi:hypothetical protein CCUS01_00492 [Colletotrichum cuscutae]|uniref:Uncharacterized protein n=1 Tax=Colletotrichum cuscutae TaxID=1209917 RepID=A0AAI9VE34_9PEZI|nr:hypothetical protein CCUS01_00492 [Colletotrichum cuscutae]